MSDDGARVPDDLRNAIIQETLLKKQSQDVRSGNVNSTNISKSASDANVADIGIKLHQIDLAQILEDRYASEDEAALGVKEIDRKKLISESDMSLIGRLLNG
jgi:hypothetical protein